MTQDRLSPFMVVPAALLLTTLYSMLLLPILVVILVSFSDSMTFSLPTNGLSLRWYAALLSLDTFWNAFVNSLLLAVAASTAALVACTAACFALSRYKPRWMGPAITFVTAPLVFPGLVLGVASLHFFRLIGITDAPLSLFLAHSVMVVPFFVRSLLPAFAGYDFDLYAAAACLGAPPLTAVRKAVLPVIAPGMVGGFLFAFYASFENYEVSMFLTDARFTTVPIQMLIYIEETPNPTIAAISVVLILKALVLLLIVDRLFGIREV